MSADPAAAPLGIIAGGGVFPIKAAEAAARGGRPVRIIGLVGSAGPDIERFEHVWVKLGEIGKLLRSLEGWGCRELLILGGVTRPDPSDIRLDLGAVKNLPDLAKLLRGGDDGVLGGIVRFFEGKGYRVLGIADAAPDLLAPIGPIGRRAMSREDEADVAKALAVLGALAPHDVGQGVVVARGRVLAVEAAEGTDAMLERVAALRAGGRLRLKGRAGVLVKVPKRGQDLRVDLPAVGEATLERLAAAELAGLAVAAGHVIVTDRSALARAADAAGLFVAGLPWPPGEG